MVFHKNLFKTGGSAQLEMMPTQARMAFQLQISNVGLTEALEGEVEGALAVGHLEGEIVFDGNLIVEDRAGDEGGV